MALFELNKVSRYYLVDKKKKYVLKDVTLSLSDHGLVTILGKSGSGKSTLLNLRWIRFFQKSEHGSHRRNIS